MNYDPIDIDDLEAHLDVRVVRFFFLKKNGQLREAIGTRNLGLVPRCGQPAGARQAPNSVVNFWDVEKSKWRCMRRNTLTFLIR